MKIDTEAAALMLGMTTNALRVWIHRHPGQIRRVGRDQKNRALYDLDDVERVQAARSMQERMAA